MQFYFQLKQNAEGIGKAHSVTMRRLSEPGRGEIEHKEKEELKSFSGSVALKWTNPKLTIEKNSLELERQPSTVFDGGNSAACPLSTEAHKLYPDSVL